MEPQDPEDDGAEAEAESEAESEKWEDTKDYQMLMEEEQEEAEEESEEPEVPEEPEEPEVPEEPEEPELPSKTKKQIAFFQRALLSLQEKANHTVNGKRDICPDGHYLDSFTVPGIDLSTASEEQMDVYKMLEVSAVCKPCAGDCK